MAYNNCQMSLYVTKLSIRHMKWSVNEDKKKIENKFDAV